MLRHAAPLLRRCNGSLAPLRNSFEEGIGKAIGPHSARVRAWTRIDSLADAYYLLRAIERKYGPLAEFRFMHDRYTSDYTTQFDIRFRNQESFERISPDSDVLHVPLPPKPKSQPGGLGLEDVEWLLHSSNGAEHDAIMDRKTLDKEGKPYRLLDCKVVRRPVEFYTSGERTIMPTTAQHAIVGKAFFRWAGFAPLEPIVENTPITSDLHHPVMRYLLRKHARQTKTKNPFEIPEWDPLPVVQSEVEPVHVDSPPPQAVQPPPPLPTSEPKKRSLTSKTLPSPISTSALLEKQAKSRPKLEASNELASQMRAAQKTIAAAKAAAKAKRPQQLSQTQPQDQAEEGAKEQYSASASESQTLFEEPEQGQSEVVSIEEKQKVEVVQEVTPKPNAPEGMGKRMRTFFGM